MPYTPPPEMASLSLAHIAELVAQRVLPPVEDWHPDKTGQSDMHITVDGRWFHQGGEITRPAMIRAFSSLLRCDDGKFWLVTPHEKLSIIVDDVPYIAVELRSEGQGVQRQIAFRTNTDELVVLNADHPMAMRENAEMLLPYVMVRNGLWAKLARPVYYELAEIALAEQPDSPGFWSNGTYFPFGVGA